MHNYSDTDWVKHFWMGRDACPRLMKSNQLFKRRLQTGEIQMMTSAQPLHFTWVGKSAGAPVMEFLTMHSLRIRLMRTC